MLWGIDQFWGQTNWFSSFSQSLRTQFGFGSSSYQFQQSRSWGFSTSVSWTGLTGNDWFMGNTGNDRFWGGAGNDLLTGGGGSDQIYGDAGNDVITGVNINSGRSIGGRNERDVLTGGTGRDVFCLGDSREGSYYKGDYRAGYATLTDFNFREDKIQFAGNANQYFMRQEQVAGSASKLDTAIYSNTGDLVAVVQDQSMSFQQFSQQTFVSSPQTFGLF